MTDLIGQSLGRYHILEQLGEGGMATVYKAYDTRLESEVAVKVIRTENLAPSVLERALKRFEREAKALAKLTHANIVKVLDYGEYDGKPYLVMPYLPGGTLKQYLQGKQMSFQEATRILLPIARALAYAHEQRMVHRDVKPSNILITHSGDPMLTDFGIAKIIDEDITQDLTGTSAAVGTPEYMAPEQVTSKDVDHRADIYALGVVFYEMVTGRKPYEADTPMAVLFKHASEPLPRPTNYAPDLPESVEQMLIKLLAKKPDDRYQSMGEFAAALERAADSTRGARTGNTLSHRASEPERRGSGKKPLVPTLIIGLVVVILGTAGVLALLRGGSEGTPTATAPFEAELLSTSTTLPAVFHSTDPKTFVYATNLGEPGTFDPALTYSVSDAHVFQNIYETLIFFSKDRPNEFVPQLASGWSISDDGRTYTFKIREGVAFQDGSILTAEDVAYSLQRGILQGGSSSPQWMYTEPLLGTGIYDIAELIDPSLVDNSGGLQSADPVLLVEACQRVKDAIVADDARGEVTFRLAQPWGPFLSTLAIPSASVMSKSWVIENRGWDGSCDTWQAYYGTTTDNDPLNRIANGTGPFQLGDWTAGEQIVLMRNDQYWRTEPAWEDGPSGPAAFERVVIRFVYDESAIALLQNGEADAATFDAAYQAQADRLVGEVCMFEEQDETSECVVENDRSLRLFRGFSSSGLYVVLFNYDIAAPNGINPYIGSGTLDGQGIPLDFFSDVHIRKAFNYCFNWDEYFREAAGGEASQPLSLALPGMTGYNSNTTHYTYDREKCQTEFELADLDHDGIPGRDDIDDLWQVGFRLQLPYNQGSTSRDTVSEILASNINAVNERFIITTVGLPFSEFAQQRDDRMLPIYTAGWFVDYYDPHNIYAPFLVGTYESYLRMPEAAAASFQDLIDKGVSATDTEQRQTIYEQINRAIYDDPPFILVITPQTRFYEQRWVEGFYFNPVIHGLYFYSLSKD